MYFCAEGPHDKSECPARQLTRENCGKLGHITKACRSKLVASASERSAPTQDDGLEVTPLFLGALSQPSTSWCVTVLVNDMPVSFKVDTGSEISVISAVMFQAMPSPPHLRAASQILHIASEEPFQEVVALANAS